MTAESFLEVTTPLPDAIVLLGADGIVLAANPAALRSMGRAHEDVVGRRLADLIADPADAVSRYLAACFGSREPVLGSLTWRTGGGEVMECRSDGAPVESAGGDGPARILLVCRPKADEIGLHRLAAIIESSDDAIVSKTLRGIVTSWNRGAERIFGFTAGETVGRSITIIFPPDRLVEEMEFLRRLAAGEHIEHFETVRVRKDGRAIDVSVTLSPIRDGTGRVVGVSKIARDISERKRAEAERAVVQAITDDALSRLDLDPLLAELLRRLRVALAADMARVLLLGEDRQALAVRASDGLDGAALGEAPIPLVEALPVVAPDGTVGAGAERTIAAGGPVKTLIGAPLTVAEGIIGAIHVGWIRERLIRDFEAKLLALVAERIAAAVERAQRYEAEREARAQAEAASRAKDEFLATLSHELRTPLNAVYGWARLLRSGQLDAEASRRALEVIERNAVAQAQLIDDLLDVSRIITGKIRLDIRAVDFRAVIEAAMDAVRPAAFAKSIALESRLTPLARPFSGDASRLQQVVWNLLTNAVKFTPPGGRIEVRLEPRETEVEITVSDNGPGIPAATLPYVFDRFRQGDSRSTRRHGGLGLGLALVRHFVELHGGTARAESAGEGQGATFTVTLPLGRTLPPPDDARHAERRDPSSTVLGGMRVVVVDDDPEARELLSLMLERVGARVTPCRTAADAVAAVSTLRPDVLVVDLVMPGEDGDGLIAAVRGLPPERGGNVAAVAITAYDRVEDRVRTLLAGFNMHLSKPVDPFELTAVVATLTGHRLPAR